MTKDPSQVNKPHHRQHGARLTKATLHGGKNLFIHCFGLETIHKRLLVVFAHDQDYGRACFFLHTMGLITHMHDNTRRGVSIVPRSSFFDSALVLTHVTYRATSCSRCESLKRKECIIRVVATLISFHRAVSSTKCGLLWIVRRLASGVTTLTWLN